ncbi:MAG: hypothetical protein U1C58_01835 [Flavobacteriaceae bacterium]|nr:hypothetical protein [Flavobacteriaceae bacterium]
MKKFLFSCVLLLSMFCFAQKQIFESPNLYTEISHHKTIAILPFTCKITYKKQPKNFSAEANKDQEESMATSIQQSLYTFLLRKNDDYFVTFQDADKTNILLKKANVFDKLDELTKDEIAKILGVDAIISGNYESHQSKSNGAAITTAVLFGGFGGKTGSGTLTLLINNGLDGELLWRFFKTMDDNFAMSTDDLIEKMMRKVSRNFPYEKS